ncbi:MAG: hypothetical protein AAB730_01150, partial [Patescibacteria group bacterium]
MSPTANKNQEFLSLAQAAREFEVSQDYLRFLIFKKKLQAVKLGRNWVTTREWLSEQRNSVRKPNGAPPREFAEVAPQEQQTPVVRRDYRGFAKRVAVPLASLILIFTISVISKHAGQISLTAPPQTLARVDEAVGDFLINFDLPPTKIVLGITKDLRAIFTAARFPSAENTYIAFRDIGRAVISRFSSFQKIIGLRAPPKELGTRSEELRVATTTVPSSQLPAPSSALEIVQVREITERREIVSTADVSV